MVTARALLVSSRVLVTAMVGRRGCCLWVWVRVREDFRQLWALTAGFPAVADQRLLALSLLGGCSWWRVMSVVGLPRVFLGGFRCRCGLGCGVGVVGGLLRRWVA